MRPTASSARISSATAGQELVNIFGLAMRFGITASQIRDNVYAYPTFSSDIKHMLGHG